LEAGGSQPMAVAVMKTVARAYEIDLTGIELASACHWIENAIAGSSSGIVDLLAPAIAEENCLLPVLCQPCQPQPALRIPAGVRLGAVDTGEEPLHRAERERVRAASFMAYKMICDWEGIPVAPDEDSPILRYTDSRWSGYLSYLAPSLFRSNYELRLPET